MLDSYTLDDLAGILGVKNKNAARNRVKTLRDLLEQRGHLLYLQPNNAQAVTPEGVELLKRLQERMDGGQSSQQARSELLIELGETEPPPSPSRLKLIERRMDELEMRLNALEKPPWYERFLRRALPRSEE